MSTSKSFNKKNNTYYVYDTQYVWSEEKQRKVRIRKCIGKLAADGTIIPTRKKKVSAGEARETNSNVSTEAVTQLCSTLVNCIDVASDALDSIKDTLLSLRSKLILTKEE